MTDAPQNTITSDPSNGNDVIAGVCGVLGGGLTGWAGGVYLVYRHFHTPFSYKDLLYLVNNHHLVIPLQHFSLWAYTPAVTGLAGAFVCAAIGYWSFHRPSEIHIRGVKWSTKKVIQKSLLPKGVAPGVVVAGIKIPETLECRHLLLLGSTGGGKTTVLWHTLLDAKKRGDKILIFSVKGDFEEQWTDSNFTRLSPYDKRSARWNVGCDVNRHSDAQALADTMIKVSDKDPMWGQGARGLLTGLIVDVQKKYGNTWGMQELAKALTGALADFKVLKSIIEKEAPEASALLQGGMQNKTCASFIMNLTSAVIPIINLGVSDYGLKEQGTKNLWSARDWLAGKTPATAILGFQMSSVGMSQLWVSSIIEQAVRQITDMPEAKPNKRRIWLIFDEVSQAGRIPSITTALEVGRSKGLRIVLGMQSLAQSRKIYDRDTSTIWEGQTSIKIITNLESTEEREWASKIVGERDLDRYTRSISIQQNFGGARQHSEQYTRVTNERLMPPGAFGEALDIHHKNGPRVVFVSGKHRMLTRVPFPKVKPEREHFIPSDWQKVGYVRPFWGKVPPKTPPDESQEQQTPKKPTGPVTPKTRETQAPSVTVTKPNAEPAPKKEEQEAEGIEKILEQVAKAVAPGAADVLALAKLMLGDMGVSTTPTPTPQTQTKTQDLEDSEGLDPEDPEEDGDEAEA